jgi:glycine dehydrogenase subunit 1
MRFVPHSEQDVREMLAAVGVGSLDDLFQTIPEEVRFRGRLDLPEPAAEADVVSELAALAGRNRPTDELVSFLGGGIYDTYVPAVVDAVTSRSEFLTSYTPYQAERSQGVLQAIFEYQTAICELTGLDVSNASMYDGATALAEAVILAAGHGKRAGGRIVVSGGVHPEYVQVLTTETRGLLPAPLVLADGGGGLTGTAALRAAVDAQTAAVVISQPSFFGGIEDVAVAAQVAHDAGALLIVVADPLALGTLASPGEEGADIAVGEGQSLGNEQNFGGPGFGFFAARKELTRRLPGRIVGETVDGEGRRGFVLTLQTREQHIRRESATSNICSNHALNALAGLVYLSWLGKEGLPALGLQLARSAAYLRERLLGVPGIEPYTRGPVFREFAVTLPVAAGGVVAALAQRGYLAGLDLGRFRPDLDHVLLLAVSERRTRAEIDAFVEEVKAYLG